MGKNANCLRRRSCNKGGIIKLAVLFDHNYLVCINDRNQSFDWIVGYVMAFGNLENGMNVWVSFGATLIKTDLN